MLSVPTVMICVGAAKAGTSWFYDYLRGHPECALRSVKELHYFDALELNEGWVQGALDRDLAEAKRVLAQEAGQPQADKVARVRDLEDLCALLKSGAVDEAAYLAYLKNGQNGAALVADVTPAYSLLGEERLQRMATMAPDVRFVFLMRDPLSRLWSHVRMVARNTLKPGEDLTKAARRLLTRVVRHGEESHIVARGDYPAIVQKLRAAIPAEKLNIVFLEELLSEKGLRQMCAFLGLTYAEGQFTRPVHVGEDIKMNKQQKLEAQAYLAPHYAFVKDSFGYVPDAWSENMVGI